MKNDTPFPFYIKNESTVFAKVLGSIGRCRSRMGDVRKGRGQGALLVSAPLALPFHFWSFDLS